MLQLSCADFTFPLLSRKQALTVLRALDFEAVDIGLFARSTHFSPKALLESSAEYSQTVQQDLEAAGLKASDIFLQIGLEPDQYSANDPDASIRRYNREVFEAAIEFCEALHCRHITGLPGVNHAAITNDEAFSLAADETAWRLQKASSAGLVYAIEPHIGSICATPQDALRFLRQVEGLTLTLDYGHFIWAGFSNDEVHQLVPYASHAHVRSGAKGQLQATADENTIDFSGLVKRLREFHYDVSICLEYVWINWQGCNRTDNISETILLRNQIASLLKE